MSTVSALQGLCLILLITPDSCVIEQWVVLGDAACEELLLKWGRVPRDQSRVQLLAGKCPVL